jgi:uncharacterized phage infection (PIP) family protein YhgE
MQTNEEKLTKMIEEIILIDIEDGIDEILAIIASKKDTQDDRDELGELRQMQTEFKEIIQEVENNELEDDEIESLIQELTDYINGDFQE